MIKKAKRSLESKALPIVLFTVFLDVLGVGILIPVLPQLITTIFIPAGFSLTTSYILLGWLTAIFPLMQFFTTPILGQLSDRYGRKKILWFSIAGTVLGYLLFAVAILQKNIPLLFFSRALDGVTGGNISVARAAVADVTPPERRTQNFGLMGAVFGIGFVFGPYIGARLATPGVNFFNLFHTPHWFNAATPFWFTAALSTVNLLLIIARFPETNKHINSKLKMVWSQSLKNIEKAVTAPGLRIVFASEFLFWGGFTFFTTFFSVLLIEKLGFQPNNVGDFFAYIGIWIAISQGTIVPLAAKYLKNHQVLRFSLLGLSGSLLVMLWPQNTTQLLLVAPLIAIIHGLTMANISALISLSAGPEMQGEVLGIDSSVQALAQAIPAIIAGYIATFGVNKPVIVGSACIAAGWLFFNLFYRSKNHILHEAEA